MEELVYSGNLKFPAVRHSSSSLDGATNYCGIVEMVDKPDLGSGGRDPVRVRVSYSALRHNYNKFKDYEN